MKRRLGKFGTIFLALALVLSVTGAAFAAWTDTITIDGTVNTGDVDINVEKLSGTWVYKVPDHGIAVVHDWLPPTTPPGDLIASATAEITSDDNVTVTLDNLFPCVDFKVDYLLHYDGSIPAMFVKGSDASPTFTATDSSVPADVELADYLNVLGWTATPAAGDGGQFYGEMWECDSTGTVIGENIPALEGYQLHHCDYILIVITLHLGQDAPMNGSASFTDELEVIQWNEYVD